MITGYTPWETEAETRNHDEHWLDYYRKAGMDFLGRAPDRLIIEHEIKPYRDGKYRLRMEWGQR